MSGIIPAALADFHFLRPLALLLLLAAPAFWLAWRHGRSDAGAWRAAVDAHLLPHLLERTEAGTGRAGIVLATLLWTLACIALAGPAWEREAMPLYRNQAARVLALELSPTMLAQDEKPNRLARARYKLDDILARSRDYQTALIGYGADAFVAAPLTDDVGTVANLVDALDPSTMPVAGNATARAIEAAVDLIEQAGLHHGDILILADSVGPDATAAARKAHAQGFAVSVLGIGTPGGAPVALAQGDFLKDASGNVVVSRLDEAGLRAVAQAGGGRYASLSADAHDLDVLLGDHVAARADEAGASVHDESIKSARWRDRGSWLLLLLLPLALAGFRRGWLMALAFALCAPWPRPAQAATFTDLWQRPDQQAAAALARGDAKTAAQVAHAPAWRGSAAYRAGDYKMAAAEYAKSAGADNAYNLGNALTNLGRFDEAIAAYDNALAQRPDMQDAKDNRKIAEQLRDRKKAQQDASGSGSQKKSSPQDAQKKPGDESQAQGSPPNQKPADQQGDQDDRQQGGQAGQNRQGDSQGGDQAAQSAAAQKGGQSAKDAQDKSADATASAHGQESENENPAKTAEAAGQKPDAQQQQALSRQIDQALAAPAPKEDKNGKPQQGAVVGEDAASSEKKQALEHLLQRVPDDPGGLLRRKFQLEYQRRQDEGKSE